MAYRRKRTMRKRSRRSGGMKRREVGTRLIDGLLYPLLQKRSLRAVYEVNHAPVATTDECIIVGNSIVNTLDITGVMGGTGGGGHSYDGAYNSGGGAYMIFKNFSSAAGAGGQYIATISPLGFAKLALIYQRWRVVGSTINIRYQGTSTSGGGELIVFPSAYSSLTTSDLVARNQPFAKVKNFNLSYSPAITVRHSMKSGEIFGYQYPIGTNEFFSQASNTNPTFSWFWHIYLRSAGGAANITGQCFITMTYDVEFYSPVELVL